MGRVSLCYSIDEVIPDENGTCRCMEHHRPHRHEQGAVDRLIKTIAVKGLVQLIQQYEVGSTGIPQHGAAEESTEIHDAENLHYFSEVSIQDEPERQALSDLMRRVHRCFARFPVKRGESMTNPFSSFGMRKVLAPLLEREQVGQTGQTGGGMSTAELDLMAVKLKKDFTDTTLSSVAVGRESGTGKVPAQLSVGNVVALLNEVKMKKQLESLGEVLDELDC